MLHRDFLEVEDKILQKKEEIANNYRRQGYHLSNGNCEMYEESVRPLNAALKALRESYFKD